MASDEGRDSSINAVRYLIGLFLLCGALQGLEFGDDAPIFALRDQEGFLHSLRQHRGQYVFLFFYPRDFTPVGLRKAKACEKLYTKLKEKNVVIYGISTDFESTHLCFHEKLHLTYDLLSDPEEQIIGQYGAKGWLETKSISFLIGPDGRIFRRYDSSKSFEHPALALRDVP